MILHYAWLKQSRVSPALSQRITRITAIPTLDVESLLLFTLLRSLTYVGWIISRTHENGSQQRADVFIATATELAEEYLTA